jgi:hypothetical protein
MSRILIGTAGMLLLGMVAMADASAQSAACRNRCDREHGAHPGRFSACLGQCPRAQAPQRSRGLSCRARCDRDYGDHPGRASACKSQCR